MWPTPVGIVLDALLPRGQRDAGDDVRHRGRADRYAVDLSGERAAELGVDLVSLEEVISGADVISLHVPLNDEPRGLIGKEALKSMKKHAYVINASRGGVIDETALARALEKGRIAGAALDVFDAEPLPEDSPLRTAPNLIMTPHLGASTREAQISVAREVALAVREILLDGDTSKAINAADLG